MSAKESRRFGPAVASECRGDSMASMVSLMRLKATKELPLPRSAQICRRFALSRRPSTPGLVASKELRVSASDSAAKLSPGAESKVPPWELRRSMTASLWLRVLSSSAM